MKLASSSRRINPRAVSDDSHLTILQPRESIPSDILSVYGGVMAMDDSDQWLRKIKFVCRIVCFCLGPGNIWRFPRQVYLFGNATYVYIYALYWWCFGTALIAFELGLGQYFNKGFARIFALCPIMEGITISMVLYCLIASMLYNMLNVYSFLYLFSAFYPKMSHSFCSVNIQSLGCDPNATDYYNSSAYIYFFKHVVEAMDFAEKGVNLRNTGILVLLTVAISFSITFGVIRMRWTPLVICVIILGALFCTFVITISAAVKDGVELGASKLFIPTSIPIGELRTWIYPMEQTVVSLGLGAGPLSTFWSVSKVRVWTYTECFVINTVVFVSSMFVGIIFFNAAGSIAHANNETIEDYFNCSFEEIQPHIILTQFFDGMTLGLSQSVLFIFYFAFFASCSFTLLEYMHIVLLYLNSFEIVRNVKRSKMVILVGSTFSLVAVTSVSEIGFKMMMALDNIFIGTSLVIIVCYQMICLVYIYGMRELCDDTEFVLGIFPNYYFQVSWYSLPSLLVMFSGCILYLRYEDASTVYDIIAVCMTVLFIIMPVIVVLIYKSVVAIRNKNFRAAVWPREHEVQIHSEETGQFKK